MLTMIHENSVFMSDGTLHVDRKFHLGMQRYAAHINDRICTVNPLAEASPSTIDVIAVKPSERDYDILPLRTINHRVVASDSAQLRLQLQNSTLIYGQALGGGEIARSLGKPYIALLEYDLDTRLTIVNAETSGLPKRTYRQLLCLRDYYARDMRFVRDALAVHCNGYPIWKATKAWARERLLYLDSRMLAADVISEAELDARLSTFGKRPVKLMYSGRFEKMKGSVDVVAVATECLKRGYDVELDCFGQGSLAAEMQTLADAAPNPGRIKINQSIPFPDLVARAKAADIFVCCHIQSDPSCTYIESFGCGLPIVGYDNRMWHGLREASQAGLGCHVGDVAAAADRVGQLIADRTVLFEMSRKARHFAAQHSFEREFARRTGSLNDALAQLKQVEAA